jgi:hypothetical protein
MKAVLAEKKQMELQEEKLKEERERGANSVNKNEAPGSRVPDPAKVTELSSPPRSGGVGKGLKPTSRPGSKLKSASSSRLQQLSSKRKKEDKAGARQQPPLLINDQHERGVNSLTALKPSSNLMMKERQPSANARHQAATRNGALQQLQTAQLDLKIPNSFANREVPILQRLSTTY